MDPAPLPRAVSSSTNQITGKATQRSRVPPISPFQNEPWDIKHWNDVKHNVFHQLQQFKAASDCYANVCLPRNLWIIHLVYSEHMLNMIQQFINATILIVLETTNKYCYTA